MHPKRLIFCICAILMALAVEMQAQSFLTNGLAAYYPFNGNALDASGNGNNGTAYNLVSTNGHSNASGSALYFNGQNGYAAVPNSPSLNVSNITLSAWLKPDVGFSDQSYIFDKHDSGVNSDGS